MARTVNYDAFISYKHCKPDSEIVDRLHKKLESFKIPKSVAKKIGRNRLNRVFRDEAELAVSDDLSEAIETALRNSKYLIAVCSPEYLKSKWCMNEIETFLQYSDRKHILLVLANGEPEDSFPEVLRYDEVYQFDDNGNEVLVKEYKEPLAADCRGENKKDRNAAVDKAVIRLIASILGVSYDELKQRHRKAQNMKRTRRTLIAFGILTVFIAVCLFFLVKISKQNAIIKQKYLDTLASTAENLLRDGRSKEAVYVARLALPDKKNKNYSDSATKIMVKSLGIYNNPDSLTCSNDIFIPTSLNNFNVSYKGKYLSVLGLERIRYVLDTESGEILCFFDEPYIYFSAFDGERGIVHRAVDGNYFYYDFGSFEDINLGNIGGALESDPNGNGYTFTTDEGIDFYHGTSLIGSLVYKDYFSDLTDNRCEGHYVYSKDGKTVWIYINDFENLRTTLVKFDTESGVFTPLAFAQDAIIYCFHVDDEYIYWYSNSGSHYGNLYIYNVNDLDDFYTINIDNEIFKIESNENYIVACTDSSIYIYDKSFQFINNYAVDDLINFSCCNDDEIILMELGKKGFHKIQNGEHSFYEINDNSYALLDMETYINGVFYVGNLGENHISGYSFMQSNYISPYYSDFNEVETKMMQNDEDREFIARALSNDDSLSEEQIYNVLQNDELTPALFNFGMVRSEFIIPKPVNISKPFILLTE